jgi:hypothetical protein
MRPPQGAATYDARSSHRHQFGRHSHHLSVPQYRDPSIPTHYHGPRNDDRNYYGPRNDDRDYYGPRNDDRNYHYDPRNDQRGHHQHQSQRERERERNERKQQCRARNLNVQFQQPDDKRKPPPSQILTDNDSSASTLSDRPASGWGTVGRPPAFPITGWHNIAQNRFGNDPTHSALQIAATQLPPPVHDLPVPPAPLNNSIPPDNTPVSADSSAAAETEPIDNRRADALRVAALLGENLDDAPDNADLPPRIPRDPLPLLRQTPAAAQTEPYCVVLRQAAVRRRPAPPATRKRTTSPTTKPLRRSTRNKSNK